VNPVEKFEVSVHNDSICRDNLEGASSSCNHRQLVCYAVSFIHVTSMACFNLIRSSSGRHFYVTHALYCFIISLLKLVKTYPFSTDTSCFQHSVVAWIVCGVLLWHTVVVVCDIYIQYDALLCEHII
jgi:hypothetical protein